MAKSPKRELAMKDGRVWSLVRPEPASPLAAAREQIYRGVDQMDAGELDAAQATFARAAELACGSGSRGTASRYAILPGRCSSSTLPSPSARQAPRRCRSAFSSSRRPAPFSSTRPLRSGVPAHGDLPVDL
jgi:hypothetical protein